MWSSQHLNIDFLNLKSWWKKSHTYVPTAILIDDFIRVFVSFLDLEKIGRIGYIDVKADDPATIINVSDSPILDVGEPGTFDEHGVTPLSLVNEGDSIFLYYAGWQRHPVIRYYLFTGLAISKDGGQSFKKIKSTPVIDRSNDFWQLRTGGCVIKNQGKFKCWYAEQASWDKGKPNTPSYNWSYMESDDGIVWPSRGEIALSVQGDVFGYGKSHVIEHNDYYHGWVSVRSLSGYKIGYCKSKDGIHWSDFDFEKRGIMPNKNCQFSNKEAAFPSMIFYKDKTYMFYNGNNFGESGLMLATVDTQKLFRHD